MTRLGCQVLRRLAGAVLGSAFALGASTARAQSATEVSLAETLYRQARELSASGNYADACPKFAESYRLDAATGTLLNLASCHESQGRFATAWLEFSDALVQSQRERRQSRIKFAEERVAALEPKLSRLTLVLAPQVDESELTLALDGVGIGRAALGVPTPVDPGPHQVEAKAPGKKTWAASVEMGAVADAQTVTIPALEPEPVPVVVPLVASAQVPATRAPEPAPAPAADVPRDRPVPTSVYIAGGATLALGVAASVTSAMYLDRRSTYQSGGRNNPDQAAAQSDHDSLQTLGVVNLALWIGTAGGAALTGYFYFTRPEKRVGVGAPRITGWATRDGAGLAATGAF